jgi:hypothetical protein
MDAILFGDAATLNRATMVERVATYAKRYYRGEADEDELARWAEEAVAHVWGDGVAVTRFVPMLALREVREHVLAAPPPQDPPLPSCVPVAATLASCEIRRQSRGGLARAEGAPPGARTGPMR